MLTDRPQALSRVLRYQTLPTGYLLHTAEARVRVQVFSPQVIQITAVRESVAFPSFSYAVCAEPDTETPSRWEETETHFLLELGTSDAPTLHLEIQKDPLRFCLKNGAGEVLNADEPAFGTVFQGERVTTYKTLREGERFVGLGEKVGGLDRRGKVFTHWNTDAFGYSPDSDPLYASIPFYIGWHAGRGYGLLFDNSFKSTFDFGASNDRFTSFGADSGAMNYFLIGGETIPEILQNYTALTGRMPLPPRWSLGYQQCRYSYYPAERLLEVARGLRRREIPADVLYLDIHYMEKYKVFTWDAERFPDPKALVQELKELGFRVVLIIDPGVKADPDYHVFESGQAADAFVKYPDGEPYHANVWPGRCVFPDFTDAKVRRWWGDFYRELLETGIAGFWNDMNEPAVWGQHVPDLVTFGWEGKGATHRQAHNVYGMQMARATFEGQERHAPNHRPFVLTRAGFAGIQRYAALWTGDNVSYDDHMLLGVRLINQLGLSGVPFAGYDIGGFVGNPSPELFSRWMQVAAFAPFFRAHTMINTPSAEPWSFGEAAFEISRNYIRLRYKLLPELYRAFYQAAQTGVPVARSLAVDFPDDPKIYDDRYANQFMLGDHLLIAPMRAGGGIEKVYLPEGGWYDFFTDRYHEGGQELYVELNQEKLPVFVRAGAMLWAQSVVQHTDEQPDETLQLHIYPNSNPQETFFYDDDGISPAHEAGAYAKRHVRFNPISGRLEIGEQEGSYQSPFRKLRVIVHGKEAPLKNAETLSPFRWIDPISNFDPFFEEGAFLHQATEVQVWEGEWKTSVVSLS